MVGVAEGLLALLVVGDKHGYQLKVEFEAAAGEAWPLNVGQVYSTLQRLERDGLVEVVETDSEGRVIYRVTAAGREMVSGWLATPVERSVTTRDEVSMKLLLAMSAGVVDPQMVVDVQRAHAMVALQDYTRLKADADPLEVAWLLHIDRLMLQVEAELRWLERVEARLDRASPPPVVSAAEGEPTAVEGGGRR